MTRTTTIQKPFSWRCRVLRMHRYVVRSTEDGSRYSTCARCGTDWYGTTPFHTGGIAASGF